MSLSRRSTCVLTLIVCLPALPLGGWRRSRRGRARVQVTVVDPSNAIVQDATVTLVGLEPATQAARPRADQDQRQGPSRSSRTWRRAATASAPSSPASISGCFATFGSAPATTSTSSCCRSRSSRTA